MRSRSALIPVLWRRTLGVIAVLLCGPLTSCDDSSVDPPTSQKVALQVSADVGAGETGRTVALRAYYRRADGSEVPIAIQPGTIAVSNASTVTGAISAEVLPCLTDTNREIAAGVSAGCRVYVVARLLSGSGAELSEDESSIVVMPRSGPLTVDAFMLPSGALTAAASTVDFAMAESGQIPGARTIAIGSSTSAPTGVLSASIEYVSGAGWLTATIPAGQSAVTLTPSATTPAPGRYEAIVRVTSTSLFTPTEIRVAYVVPQPPKNVTITGAGNGAGLVLVTPNGTTCTTTAGQVSGFCTVPAAHGSTVTLTASPAVGSAFTGWSGACQGTGECTLVMDQGRPVTATFTILKRDLAVDVAGAGSGTITSSPAGISCTATAGQKSGTCGAQFDHSTLVTLTPVPNSATSAFTGWSGACQGTGDCVVTMTEARSVTATFDLLPRSIHVSLTGGGTGTVTSSPAGIACTLTNGQTSGTCTTGFGHGTSVVLTATAGTDMTFTGWSGACTGTGTCTVTMDQTRSVTAEIRPPLYPVTVNMSGNGRGFVFGCSYDGQPGACVREFPAGTVVNVSVSTDYFFGRVSLSAVLDPSCSNVSGPESVTCRVVVNGPKTLFASLTVPSTTVTVTGAGTGSGTIFSDPSGIHCTITGGQATGNCRAEFIMTRTYTHIRLRAVPVAGSAFFGVAGCTSATPDSCVIGFNGPDRDTTVTATFELLRRNLDISMTGGGTGTVTSSPGGIACTMTSGQITGTCSTSFAHGTSVALTANPGAGMTFAGWSGAGCTGTGTCTVTMDQARTVTANITSPLETLTITSAGGNGFATVNFFAPPGLGCSISPQGAACSHGIPAGSEAEFFVESVSSQGSMSITGCDRYYGSALAQGCFVRMNGPRTVSVAVNRPSTRVTVIGSGTGAGRVTDQYIDCRIAAGVASGVCSSDLYGSNDATLTATPEPGSTFTGWINCSGSSGSTCTISALDSRTVTATFAVVRQTLTVDIAGPGSGTVTSSPPGISCTGTNGQMSGTCATQFDHSTSVSVSKAAASGSTFTGWSGACQGTGSCILAMTEPRRVTATFAADVRPLSVLVTGGGTGTVTSSSPAGIACTATGTGIAGACTAVFAPGTTVTLVANPGPGTTFAGWDGECGASATCTFPLNSASVAIAVMVPSVTPSPGTYPLSVAYTGNGTGTVTFSPVATECFALSPRPSACVREFPAGTVVELKAAKFGSFGGTSVSGCTLVSNVPGISYSCQLTLDGARTVMVRFATPATSVTVIGSGSGSGTVTSTSGGISCTINGSQMTGPCFADAFGGTAAFLNATPAAGSVFAGWSGCPSISGSGTSCTVGANSSAVVTAIFNASALQTEEAAAIAEPVRDRFSQKP